MFTLWRLGIPQPRTGGRNKNGDWKHMFFNRLRLGSRCSWGGGGGDVFTIFSSFFILKKCLSLKEWYTCDKSLLRLNIPYYLYTWCYYIYTHTHTYIYMHICTCVCVCRQIWMHVIILRNSSVDGISRIHLSLHLLATQPSAQTRKIIIFYLRLFGARWESQKHISSFAN